MILIVVFFVLIKCDAASSCLDCVRMNCVWVQGGSAGMGGNCLPLSQLEGTPFLVIGSGSMELCPINHMGSYVDQFAGKFFYF